MVGQSQWNCRHPCSMSHAIPVTLEYQWSDSQDLAIRKQKVLIENRNFLFFSSSDLCSFLCLIENPCQDPFLDEGSKNHLQKMCCFLSKGISCLSCPLTTKTLSFSDHQSMFCVCSSPMYTSPILLNPPLPFPFPFSFLLFKLTISIFFGLPDVLVVVPWPKTWSFSVNVASFAGWLVDGPLSVFILWVVFRNECSACIATTASHAERRILHWAFPRAEQFNKDGLNRIHIVRCNSNVTKRKRTGKFFSLSLLQIISNNERQCCQVITERK